MPIFFAFQSIANGPIELWKNFHEGRLVPNIPKAFPRRSKGKGRKMEGRLEREVCALVGLLSGPF